MLSLPSWTTLGERYTRGLVHRGVFNSAHLQLSREFLLPLRRKRVFGKWKKNSVDWTNSTTVSISVHLTACRHCLRFFRSQFYSDDLWRVLQKDLLDTRRNNGRVYNAERRKYKHSDGFVGAMKKSPS